jgi:hypothetical protein
VALSVDEINALTEKLWVPVIADNTFGSNPLMARLWKRGTKEQGGTKIRAPLMYSKVGAAGAIRGFETMNTTADDQFTAADFDWKEYYAAIILSRREMFMNSGVPEQISHLSAKSQASEMTLRDLMGTGLFSNGLTNTKLIDGLEAIINDSNTYPSEGGGIDRGTESWWRPAFRTTAPYDIRGEAEAAIYYRLQLGVGRCTQQPNSPTMIVTNQGIFDYIFKSTHGPMQMSDPGLGDLGFHSIMFRGIPIVVDTSTA